MRLNGSEEVLWLLRFLFSKQKVSETKVFNQNIVASIQSAGSAARLYVTIPTTTPVSPRLGIVLLSSLWVIDWTLIEMGTKLLVNELTPCRPAL